MTMDFENPGHEPTTRHGADALSVWCAERGRDLARGVLATIVALMLLGPAGVSAREQVRFVSPEAAFEQGLSAHRGGNFALAEQALRFASERGHVLGRYALARLYADSNAPFTNHERAYELYNSIVVEHSARIDVDDDPRAVYVGKALTAVAGYVLRGIPQIGLLPNPERAAGYFQEAATFFRDHDAQFELAKLYLAGEGVRPDTRKAVHWLSTLSQAGHPGAQAFLADLYWRGKSGLPKSPDRALALITLAAENAPPHERIWIEDIYQSIYCGLSAGVREGAAGLIASFRHRYAPRPGTEPRDTIGLTERPYRSCADGTSLPALEAPGEPTPTETARRTPTASERQPVQGNMLDIGRIEGRR
jgi:hypothetical protein